MSRRRRERRGPRRATTLRKAADAQLEGFWEAHVRVEVQETWTHPLPPGWVVRSATSRDAGGVVEMMNARTQAFYGENQSTPHDIEVWWSGPRFELEKDLRLVLDRSGSVAGLVNVDNPGEPYARLRSGPRRSTGMAQARDRPGSSPPYVRRVPAPRVCGGRARHGYLESDRRSPCLQARRHARHPAVRELREGVASGDRPGNARTRGVACSHRQTCQAPTASIPSRPRSGGGGGTG